MPGEIEKYLQEARAELAGEPAKIVHYLPFAPAKTPDPMDPRPIRERAEDFKNNVALRSLAIQVFDAYGENGQTQATPEQLEEAFGKLSDEDKRWMAFKAVEKEPLILQHGDPDLEEKLKRVTPDSTVYVLAHGTNSEAKLWQTDQIHKDSTPSLDAGALVDQMDSDGIPKVGKIKLIACGSGGELLNGVAAACATHEKFKDTTIRGYGLDDDHQMFDHREPLEDLHLGMHKVYSREGAALQKEDKTLKSDAEDLQREIQRQEQMMKFAQDGIDRYENKAVPSLLAEQAEILKKLATCPEPTAQQLQALAEHEGKGKQQVIEQCAELKKSGAPPEQIGALRKGWESQLTQLTPEKHKLERNLKSVTASLAAEPGNIVKNRKEVQQCQKEIVKLQEALSKNDLKAREVSAEIGKLPDGGRMRGRNEGFEAHPGAPKAVTCVTVREKLKQMSQQSGSQNIIDLSGQQKMGSSLGKR